MHLVILAIILFLFTFVPNRSLSGYFVLKTPQEVADMYGISVVVLELFFGSSNLIINIFYMALHYFNFYKKFSFYLSEGIS